MTDADSADDELLEAYRQQVHRPLLRLFRIYGPDHNRWLLVGLAASLITHTATLVTPVVLGTTIDAVFTGEGSYSLPLVPQAWLPTEPTAQFWFSVGLVGTALFLSALLSWIRGVAMNYFAHGVMLDIRVDAYEKMQRLDMAFFDNKETGEVMSILNNDTSNLEIFLDNGLSESVRISVLLVGIASLLFYTNWQLAAITLGVVPLMVGFTWWFMRAAEPLYAAHRDEIGNLNTRLENSLSGIELVKTASTEGYEHDRVDRVSGDLFDAEMAAMKLSYFYRPGMKFLTGVALLATFVIGGIWVFSGPPLFLSGTLSVGNFVVFILLTQQLTGPLSQLSNIVDWYENATASGKRICGLRDIPVRIEDGPESVALDTVDGRIEYDDVSFAYEGEEPVLDGVDFTVEAGETVALVGATGAGKSTVAKLLLRLYDVSEPSGSDGSSGEQRESDGVDEGGVRVDGHDVRDLRLADLRESIGYVSQDTFLFDGTVAENIRYGRFDASDDAVQEAAKAAEAHEFIESFSEGYQTRVGERGVKLSGGQRQRIALARVVLQDPEIILLDEATASVDTETEYLIQRSLDRLTADRTTIAIAHRLSTIKDADTILVLDEGRVAERGTHEELLAAGGLYANLWGVQAGEMDELPDELLGRASAPSVD